MKKSAFRKTIRIAINDIKIIFRDKSLLMLAVVPLLIFLLLKFGLPLLVEEFSILVEFINSILLVLLILMSIFPSFILSFVVMDEKETSLLQVFNVLPHNYNFLLNIRIISSYIAGTVISIFVLYSTSSFYETKGSLIITALTISLYGPQVFLLIVWRSKQKVEAMTWMKGLNFVYMLPVVLLFVHQPLIHVMAIIPTYWLFKIQLTEIAVHQFWFATIGIVQSLLYIFLIKKYVNNNMISSAL